MYADGIVTKTTCSIPRSQGCPRQVHELHKWLEHNQIHVRCSPDIYCFKTVPGLGRWLEERGCGSRQVNFKLRDWLFARQRYWGEPFPVVFPEGSDVSLAPVPTDSRSHARMAWSASGPCRDLGVQQQGCVKSYWVIPHCRMTHASKGACHCCQGTAKQQDSHL